MGANKEKDFKFGLKTTYWTIGEFEIKFAAKTAIIAMFGYTSEEAYRNGEAMTEQKTLQFTGDDFILTKDCDIMATLWKMVASSKVEKEKIGEEIVDIEKNWFADSEPVLEVGQKFFKNMILSIYDRLNFSQFFPETGNILTQMIVRDIIKKIEISSEEREAINFKSIENGEDGKQFVQWDAKKETSKDIDFSTAEIQFLKNQVEKMDKENKINQKNLDVCLSIKNWKKEEPKEAK